MPTSNKLKNLTVTQFSALMATYHNSLPSVATYLDVTPRALQIWAKKRNCGRVVTYQCQQEQTA